MAYRQFARPPLASTLVTLTMSVALMSGCVGYNSYNAPSAADGTADAAPRHGFSNPNDDPFPPLMTESVRWVITRYPAVERAEWSMPLGVPPEGAEFAVSLPVGVGRDVYKRVVERIGYGAQPVTPSNEHLPTYHIARVWVNGDEAKVDIVRPVPGLPAGNDGKTLTQGITVRLRGGLRPWHVTSHRVWAMNTLPIPAINYIPEVGARTPRPVTNPVTKPTEDGGQEVINLPG